MFVLQFYFDVFFFSLLCNVFRVNKKKYQNDKKKSAHSDICTDGVVLGPWKRSTKITIELKRNMSFWINVLLWCCMLTYRKNRYRCRYYCHTSCARIYVQSYVRMLLLLCIHFLIHFFFHFLFFSFKFNAIAMANQTALDVTTVRVLELVKLFFSRLIVFFAKTRCRFNFLNISIPRGCWSSLQFY